MANLITRERALRNLDNRSTTAAENKMLDANIAGISDAIHKFCRREFVARDYDELYNGSGERRLFLRRYPIISVQAVRHNPTAVVCVKNTDTATNQQARVSVQNTGLLLTRVASGTASSNTLAYSSYATLQNLATAIAALGNGWSAQVVGDAAGDYYGLWPAQDLWVQPTFGDGVTSQGALNARGQWAELRMHTAELAGYDFDPRGWLHRGGSAADFFGDAAAWPVGAGNFRVQYTAGYLNVPEDVQEACAQWVAAAFWQSKRDPGLSQEQVPGLVSRSPFSNIPPGVVELLSPHRNYNLLTLGG